MSEFHDPDLRQELGRLSGPYPDDNVAFAAWQRRVGQVRRRRVVAWTTAAALSLVVGTVGVAALQRPDRHSLVPSNAGDTSTEVSVTIRVATTAHQAPTTESTEPQTSEVTTASPETTPDTNTGEVAVDETAAPSAGGSPSGSPTQVPSPVPQPPTGSQPATRTFSAIGGSITVRQDGDQLTVVSAKAAAGFNAEPGEHSGSRVKVTFTSDGHESQITVKLEHGVMKPDVSEKSDNHDSTVPADIPGADQGSGGKSG